MKSVFISSTFKDMQAERDMLHERIFPRLRKVIGEYGEDIQELDLRWGVDTANMSEEESGHAVLKVCIDAIDRCKPFFVVLLGERYGELAELVSLEKRVSRRAPPFFLWHTADDTCVPVENSLLLDKALRAKGVDAELHVYPHGSHGQSLADHTVFPPGQDWVISAPCAVWVAHCTAWLRRHFGDYALAPHPDEKPEPIVKTKKKK